MMKLTRRFLTLLLCLCMVLPLIPAVNAEAVWVSTLKYRIYGNQAQITGYYTKPSGDITIPTKIDGYTVYSIAPNAFKDCTGITSVTFPDTIELIGSEAFSGCSNLTSVYLGKKAKPNTKSFYNCSGLTYMEVSPDNTILSSNGDGLLYTKDKTGLGYYIDSGYTPSYGGSGGGYYSEKKDCPSLHCNNGKKDCPHC